MSTTIKVLMELTSQPKTRCSVFGVRCSTDKKKTDESKPFGTVPEIFEPRLLTEPAEESIARLRGVREA